MHVYEAMKMIAAFTIDGVGSFVGYLLLLLSEIWNIMFSSFEFHMYF